MPTPIARPPVRLTERLLAAGLTIKDDLTKAFASWEENFRDPVKEALLAMPQATPPEVTQITLGGVKILLAKKFPESTFDTPALTVKLSQAVREGALELITIQTMIDTGVLVVAKPAEVANVLVSRNRIASAQQYILLPENPLVPSRIELRWNAVAGAVQPAGPLADLSDRIALAAAGTTGRPVPTGVPMSPALQEAMRIDAAHAAAALQPPPAPTPRPAVTPAARTPARRRRRTDRDDV